MRVRERTDLYTSYDVTYRTRSTTGPEQGGEESYTISGVLNVPTGPGPFPAVVLATAISTRPSMRAARG